MLRMRLDGLSYQAIATQAGISRQRVQQLLSPQKAVRDFVIKQADGKCQICGIKVNHSGHVHHKACDIDENYNDIEQLQLLCLSCHRKSHHDSLDIIENVTFKGDIPKVRLTITLPPEMVAALRELGARRYGSNARAMSLLVREAIIQYFQQHQPIKAKVVERKKRPDLIIKE